MPYTYTNRKGVEYFLHAKTTAKGKTRYAMTRESDGALAELPEGYEIAENPNGLVSVRQAKPRLILPAERELVETCLREYGLKYYRVGVKGKEIALFEPNFDIDEVAGIDTPFAGRPESIAGEIQTKARETFGSKALEAYMQDRQQRARQRAEKYAHFSPVLRFTLADKKKRLFDVARMTYRGRGGWHDLDMLPLPRAARKYIKHLGNDSFFDLV